MTSTMNLAGYEAKAVNKILTAESDDVSADYKSYKKTASTASSALKSIENFLKESLKNNKKGFQHANKAILQTQSSLKQLGLGSLIKASGREIHRVLKENLQIEQTMLSHYQAHINNDRSELRDFALFAKQVSTNNGTENDTFRTTLASLDKLHF